MRALTTSDLTKILLEKGYKAGFSEKIHENKWDADRICFEEDRGYSRIELCKFHQYEGHREGSGRLETILSYRKLKATQKKEVQLFIESLPQKQ